MRKILAACVAVAVALVVSASTAHAQGGANKKVLQNLIGNGAHNKINLGNHGNQPNQHLIANGGFNKIHPGQGVGNGFKGNGNGIPGLNGPVFNGNFIVNSGNGANNQIVLDKGGSGSLVNINVVVNSGNGSGNVIHTGGGNGLVNVNVITNSGNGANNVVQAR